MGSLSGVLQMPKVGIGLNFNVKKTISSSIRDKKPKILNPIFHISNQSNKSININDRPVISDSLKLYGESPKHTSELSFNYDFERKEFIMNSPVTQHAFQQFEKRFEGDVSDLKITLGDLKNDFKDTNKILNEIKETLVTEEKVSDIIEATNNKKIASWVKYVFVGLVSSLTTLALQWLMKVLNIL